MRGLEPGAKEVGLSEFGLYQRVVQEGSLEIGECGVSLSFEKA